MLLVLALFLLPIAENLIFAKFCQFMPNLLFPPLNFENSNGINWQKKVAPPPQLSVKKRPKKNKYSFYDILKILNLE